MPDKLSIASSVAVPASPAQPDFHSLPEEMQQKILGCVYAGDLVAFESSHALRGLITPKLFNDTARNFIAARERTLLGPPWPSSEIFRCYAWVREQAGGSDEEFAQDYPHAARLMRLMDVCNTVGGMSPAGLNSSRLARRELEISGHVTCCPIVLPSAYAPAFPIWRGSAGLSLVTPTGTISCPSELADCSPQKGTRGDFVVVNSMNSRADGGLVVSRGIGGVGGYGLYRASTDKVYPLPFELKDCDLFAVSDDAKFVAATSWSSHDKTSRLLVYSLDDHYGVYKVTHAKLQGLALAVSVDSEGIAVVSVQRPLGACPENERYVGYEVRPGEQPGAPIRLFLNNLKPLSTSNPWWAPGYVLAPGEDCVIQNGPRRGDLTLQSRHDGRALILRPRDPAQHVPQSICLGPAKSRAVVTYACVRPSDGAIFDHYIEVFDLTSATSEHAKVITPTVGFEVRDRLGHQERLVACLTPDASRLTVVCGNRVAAVKLIDVDLSPDGRAR